MNDMMKHCCNEQGKPDFNKMKQFMKDSGMQEFTDDHITMMRQFCSGEGMPDMAEMRAMMEKCGCQPSWPQE